MGSIMAEGMMFGQPATLVQAGCRRPQPAGPGDSRNSGRGRGDNLLTEGAVGIAAEGIVDRGRGALRSPVRIAIVGMLILFGVGLVVKNFEIVSEEEELVFLDGPTNVPAEVVICEVTD